MIETKFKVWDKQNKEWDTDYTLKPDGRLSCGGFDPLFLLDRCVVVQYIGRSDHKGQELYRLDIIQATPNAYREDNNFYIDYDPVNMCYVAVNCVFHQKTEGYSLRQILDMGGEKIGSVCENPELVNRIGA